MKEYEEDLVSNNVEISNVADWMRFSNPTTQKSDDLFDIDAEEVLKL